MKKLKLVETQNKKKIYEIIIESINDLNRELKVSEVNSPSLETRLYGSKSALDSIGLVTLIAAVEEKISTEFQKDIILADERAMSQRHSPFGSIGSLVEYIEKLLVENR